MGRYVVEYDHNSVAWLLDVGDKSRVCLEHGMLLEVDVIARTDWPTPGAESPQEVP